MAFNIKQGDTRPKYVAVLTSNGTPIDLTNATSIKFLMRVEGQAPKINAAAAFTDRPNGQVTYTWTGSDTDTVATYQGEFEITWSDGGVETVPNDGYLRIEIEDDIA